MFERYTEKARRVIFFARYEASQFGAPAIEPDASAFREQNVALSLAQMQQVEKLEPGVRAECCRCTSIIVSRTLRSRSRATKSARLPPACSSRARASVSARVYTRCTPSISIDTSAWCWS